MPEDVAASSMASKIDVSKSEGLFVGLIGIPKEIHELKNTLKASFLWLVLAFRKTQGRKTGPYIVNTDFYLTVL